MSGWNKLRTLLNLENNEDPKNIYIVFFGSD